MTARAVLEPGRAFGIGCMLLGCALAACSESPPASGSGGQAVGAGTTGGSTAAGTNAAAGNSGGAGASPGGAGAGGGVGAGGSAGAGAVSGAAGTAGAAAGACGPSAIVCDDFEKYPEGASDLSPDWLAYTYSGTVTVDATKPRGGQQSLHLTVQAGMRRYADLIRETRGQELLPRKHYGRLMVWLSQVPQGAQHWNLNCSIGPLTGFPEEIVKVAEGGMFGKLMSNYAQRGRVVIDGEYPPRGVGPENGDPGADADCAVAAPTQTIAAGKWVCWEWEFDGSTDATSAYLWLDGQPMTEIDAIGVGKQCQGPGFNGKPMSATYGWETPRVWDKLIIGWEQYQDMPAQELWIDDVAVGPERIGCPPQ